MVTTWSESTFLNILGTCKQASKQATNRHDVDMDWIPLLYHSVKPPIHSFIKGRTPAADPETNRRYQSQYQPHSFTLKDLIQDQHQDQDQDEDENEDEYEIHHSRIRKWYSQPIYSHPFFILHPGLHVCSLDSSWLASSRPDSHTSVFILDSVD